jgi:hypothetical protein
MNPVSSDMPATGNPQETGISSMYLKRLSHEMDLAVDDMYG